MCIDLVLTKLPRMFQITCVLETRLSDFHLMAVTIMRKNVKKMRPRVINCWSCRDFSKGRFRGSLINNLSNKVFVNKDGGLQNFAKRPWIL